MKKNLVTLTLGGVVLYLASTSLSYAAFSYLGRPAKVEEIKSPLGEKAQTFDQSLPRTETCPLNGALYPKPQREWWEKHRPLGVMIENHQDARPQSGLTRADIIYEAVAEGGITRFLAVYFCQDAEMVGPVRSARTYFLDFISEYGDFPLYAHVGGANTPGPANAIGQIGDYGWAVYNDLNQFSVSFPTFWKDSERLKKSNGDPVDTEHTMYSTTTKLWQFAAEKRGLTDKDEKGKKWDEEFVSWNFKEEASEKERPATFAAEFNFWEGYDAYRVKWEYDPAANAYKRFNGGQPHLDKNDDSQITAKNVVVAFMTEKGANDGYEDGTHLLYGTKGGGKALIFQDGQVIEGEWKKKDRLDLIRFYDNKGAEIKFNPGQIWIEILPTGTEVKY